jgi:hypothetical protein
VARIISRQRLRRGRFRREAAVSALALVIGFGGVLKASAQAQDRPPAQDQQTPSPPQQTSQSPAASPSASQAHLPQIVVNAPKKKPKPNANTAAPKPAAPQPDATTAAQTALDNKMHSLDRARDDNLLPKSAPRPTPSPARRSRICRKATTRRSTRSSCNCRACPTIPPSPIPISTSAANTPTSRPGSTASCFPKGVSGSGPFLDTNFIGSMSLLTGTLPAQYGLRTAGVLDITSRAFATPGGERQHLWRQPADDHAELRLRRQRRQFGVFRLRARQLELSASKIRPQAINANHDQTDQGKFFGYASTLLNESTRFSVISAASYSTFQIPNNPNQMPLGDFGPANYNSSTLNENEYDTYAVLQYRGAAKAGTDGDAQLSVFSRYAEVHFVPDVFGDLVFNDVASDVIRQSTAVPARSSTRPTS